MKSLKIRKDFFYNTLLQVFIILKSNTLSPICYLFRKENKKNLTNSNIQNLSKIYRA